MDYQDANAKESVKSLASNLQYRTFRSKSKDKLLNVSGKNINYVSMKNNMQSKAPFMFRSPTNLYNTTKHIEKEEEKLDDCVEKLKPSHIPRRRINKQSSTKEKLYVDPNSNEHHFLEESKNIQRVQMLINQDYHPEDHSHVATIARPIPTSTLGQIYAQYNLNETNTINDWFVELNTPTNSLDSNYFNATLRQMYEVKDVLINNGLNDEKHQETRPSCSLGSSISKHKHCTSNDDNFSDTLSIDQDYPRRDYESGYRSLSPPTHTSMGMTLEDSDSFVTTLNERIEENIDKLIKKSTPVVINDGPANECTGSVLKVRPTMVLAKATPSQILNTSLHNTHNKYELNTNCTGKSGTNPDVKDQEASQSKDSSKNSQNQVPVASYVECPSEIHQKTTDFDEDGCGCDTSNTPSSLTATDLQSRDKLSSQFTIGHDNCTDTLEWCHHCCGSAYDVLNKSDGDDKLTSTLKSSNNNDDERTVNSSLKDSDYNPFEHQYSYCWNKHKEKQESIKSQRFRRFPSNRYKLPRPLSAFRRRISVYFCTRKFNRVWKKTAERWAIWSAKSPHRIKKRRAMLFFQRSMIWEDVDVQTSTRMYKEAGTNSVLKEHKSRAIMTFAYFENNCTTNGRPSELFITNSQLTKSGFTNTENSVFHFTLDNQNLNSIDKQKVYSSPFPIGFKNKMVNGFKERVKVMKDKGIQKTDDYIDETTDSCPNTKSQSNQIESIAESTSEIQICEITTAEKDTVTDSYGYPLKDNVTSTYLHLDDIQMVDNKQAYNANTPMYIVCNNAETNVKYPPLRNNRSASVFTANSDVIFHKTCGINTEPTKHASVTISTSPYMTNTISCNVDTMTPVETKQEIRKDFIAQATNCQSTLMISANKMTSKSTTPVQTVAAGTLKKDYMDTGLSVHNSGVSTSKACLTVPYSLTCECICNANKIVSRGTDTNDIPMKKSSAENKLKTYFNTGMLINTIVDQAVQRGSPKMTTFTETKSIGNTYTSDIGTCTNTVLRDSVIETEKEINPARLSANTNTFLEQHSKFTEQSSLTVDVAKQMVSENWTQYSYNDHKEEIYSAAGPSCRQSDRYGQSCLMSIRSLNSSFEDVAAQTEIALCNYGQTNKEHLSHMTTASKTSSNLNTGCMMNNLVLSSALDADKWIKAGIEKGFQSLLAIECATDNSCGCDLANERRNQYATVVDSETQSIDQPPAREYSNCIRSRTAASENTVKNDSDESVVVVGALATTTKAVEEKTDSESLNVQSMMEKKEHNQGHLDDKLEVSNFAREHIVQRVDNATSGIAVVKGNKEINLQCCPEFCDAGIAVAKENKEINLQACPDSLDSATECLEANDRKSASVLTSRCILPSLSHCKCKNCSIGDLSGDCLFVYGKPRCVVHTTHLSDTDSTTKKTSTLSLMPAKLDVQSATVFTSGFQVNPSVSDKETSDVTNLNKSSHGPTLMPHKLDVRTATVSTSGFNLNPSVSYKETSYTPNTNMSVHGPNSIHHKLDVRTATVSTSCFKLNPITSDKESSNIPDLNITSCQEMIPTQKTHEVRSIGVITSCYECKQTLLDKTTSGLPDFNISTDSKKAMQKTNEVQSIGVITSNYPCKSTLLNTSAQGSISQKSHEVQSVGVMASCNECKPTVCDTETSIVSDLLSCKASMQKDNKMQSAAVFATSCQTKLSVCDKGCSSCDCEISSLKDSYHKENEVQTVSVTTSYNKPKPTVGMHTSSISDLLSPKEYEIIYKTSILIAKQIYKEHNLDVALDSNQTDAAVEAWLRAEMQSAEVMTSPDTQSATVMTSHCNFKTYAANDQSTEPVGVYDIHLVRPACDYNCCNKLLEVPARDDEHLEDSVKTHIIASCRYYSTLITKHLDHVKENLARHLSPPTNSDTTVPYHVPEKVTFSEACTMKPSARADFGCQTLRHGKGKRALDPVLTETDICQHDKKHLYSVHYMLTAIEGRMRRLKS